MSYYAELFENQPDYNVIFNEVAFISRFKVGDEFSYVESNEPLSEPETSEVKPKEEESKAVEKNEKICPLCGKALVIRIARYGKYAGHEFLGCTGYPKCNYIKNLD